MNNPYHFHEAPVSRAEILGKLKSMILKAGSVLALVSEFMPARAQTSDDAAALGHLNFLLTLEITQLAFYQACLSPQANANASPNMNQAFQALPADNVIQQGMAIILQDKLNHISILNSFFTNAFPAVQQTSFTFDFSLSGNIPDIATNYVNMLLLAQILEDIGVRTVKGMLQKFTSTSALRKKYLPTLLSLHSVLGRHAAYIRLARRRTGQAVTPWVFGNGLQAAGLPDQSNQASLVNNVYLSEDNTNQAQISLPGLNSHSEITPLVASAAFDEVLTQSQARLILQSIIKNGLL